MTSRSPSTSEAGRSGFANVNGHRIRYELQGEPGRPLVTFINGLTQNADLWTAYAATLSERGYRVLAYDMLGQAQSAKPVLGIEFTEHADLLAGLLDRLQAGRTHLAGISFGGVVALDFAIRHPQKVAGLAVMSAFAELSPQLELLGNVMYEGLTQCGLPYLQSMLYPMNMSSRWLAANRARLPAMMRGGYISNDLYALQNLMESFIRFEPLTPRLKEIRGPVLLMNGEHDFFTPRECHELLRRELPNCRLVIIQHAYHAFTVELPDITLRQLHEFFRAVDERRWVGDGSVWVAADRADATPHVLPFHGDHTRAIQLPLASAAARRAPRRTVAATGGRRR
ncbi:alpha/beta hydrolase [Ramlibacter sp. PS3R-8]|uniref:alpha/beta fold hydrolase n=1 Tax=Ramlibacter sp. PS3R-8 TaxID=3133437 RepID=UPI00309B78F2